MINRQIFSKITVKKGKTHRVRLAFFDQVLPFLIRRSSLI